MESAKEKLIKLGWEEYIPDNWKMDNRYVDMDLPYIDIHCYHDEEKYGSYLTVEEFMLFSELIKGVH